MGKATIIESLGAGHYRIMVQFENAKVEARLTSIDQKIADSTTKLIALGLKVSEAKTQYNSDMVAIYEYINYSNQPGNPPLDLNELAQLQGIGYASKFNYDLLVIDEKREKLRKTSLEKEKVYLEKFCPSEFEAYAWCVAYNEGLTGIVKTIECDYLLERDVITNQTRNNTGFWLPDGVQTPDAQLQHPMSSGVHAAWFNLAMVPCLQKFSGRYRIATIYGLDKINNQCDLIFDGTYDVNENENKIANTSPILPVIGNVQQMNYSGAPIIYMLCNADIFEIGDKVIVDLHHGTGVPTVIGFHDNPRQCAGPGGPPGGWIQIVQTYFDYGIHTTLWSGYVLYIGQGAFGDSYGTQSQRDQFGLFRLHQGDDYYIYYQYHPKTYQSTRLLINDADNVPLYNTDTKHINLGAFSADLPALLFASGDGYIPPDAPSGINVFAIADLPGLELLHSPVSHPGNTVGFDNIMPFKNTADYTFTVQYGTYSHDYEIKSLVATSAYGTVTFEPK